MSLIEELTKNYDLAQAPLTKRFGVTGARRFWLGWGCFTFALLIVIAVMGMSAVMAVSEEVGAKRTMVMTLVVLTLAAASLTRFLVRVFDELHQAEQSSHKDKL